MATDIKKIQTNEGNITVLFEQDNSLPIFNMRLVLQNSGYITDEIEGLTYLFSSILNEGTKTLGSTKFANLLDSKAISIYSSFGLETFVIEISCMAEYAQESLQFLEQILKDPNITKKTLEKVKLTAIGKIKKNEDNFDIVAANGLKKILFKGTNLQNSQTGTTKSINSIELNDIKKRFENLLNIDNLLILAGGKIKFKDFEKYSKSMLKTFSKKKNKFLVQKIDIQKSKIVSIKKPDNKQAYIYFGSKFDADFNSKENHKIKLFSYILGGGFGSRLTEEIRVKQGLAYSIFAHVVNNKSSSYLTGYMQTKIQDNEKAVVLIKDVMSEFIKNGITQKELDDAKRFILGSDPLTVETYSQRQSKSFMMYYKNKTQKDDTLAKLKDLKLKSFNDFIAKHKEILDLSIFTVR